MNQTTDRVFLRELGVECIIGFLDWERLVKQTVYLDIEAPIDCRRAALNDEVAGTLDYKRLSKVVIAFVAASEFKLVETLADRTAKLSVVKTGPSSGGKTVILSGVKLGDTVITEGADRVDDGSKVMLPGDKPRFGAGGGQGQWKGRHRRHRQSDGGDST